MIFHPVVQGSYEWVMLRLGVPTASAFDAIITPKTLKLSAQSDKYARQLIVEEILRAPFDEYLSTGFMMRGNALESEAVAWYELTQDVDTSDGGFALRDDRRAGASTDRIVGPDGLLELKCPSAEQHIAYLLDSKGIGYQYQVQGQLWVYEREWVDTVSYHPSMPKALVRQSRDEEFIGKLANLVNVFHEMKMEMKQKLHETHGLFDEDDLAFPPLQVIAGGAA